MDVFVLWNDLNVSLLTVANRLSTYLRDQTERLLFDRRKFLRS